MPRLRADIVKFRGLKLLDADERLVLERLSAEYFEKIKRQLDNIAELSVDTKAYQKEGGRRKWSIHIRVYSPTRKVHVSCMSHDWELARALHKAFNDAMVDIKNCLHLTSGRRWKKPYERG